MCFQPHRFTIKLQKKRARIQCLLEGDSNIIYFYVTASSKRGEKLYVSQCISLEVPFTLEEIGLTLFSCNPHKSSGPDGLSFLFYQSF